MSRPPKRVVVLWTGGKDSCLALFRSLESKMHVCALATFVPDVNAAFKAHPLEIIQRQARELDLPHELVPVAAPYRRGYEDGLARLKTQFRADAVVTGDIDEVAGFPNWISQCSATVALETVRPLWRQSRISLLREIVQRGIQAQISWIDDARLPSGWLGRYIDSQFIGDIADLAKTTPIGNGGELDICGENGEYHTMVRDLPQIATLRG